MLCPCLCCAGAFSAVAPHHGTAAPISPLALCVPMSDLGSLQPQRGHPWVSQPPVLARTRDRDSSPGRAGAHDPFFTDHECARRAHVDSMELRQVAMWTTQHLPGQLSLCGHAGWDLWGGGAAGVSTAGCHIPTATLQAMTSQYGLIATSLILCL